MTDEDELQKKPSKSERKRAAHAAQDLGETLIGLRDSELEALELPERLVDAIRDARRISSRGGGARQRQYIGKLMREIDLEPIRAALAAHREQTARAAEKFKRLEAWREKLISEGTAALEELERWRPGLDRAEWARRIGAAQAERKRIVQGPQGSSQRSAGESGSTDESRAQGPAGRELFRALRSLFEQPGEGARRG